MSLEDADVLDLYSGIGSFGIECISRGAKSTTFVENDKLALTVLKKNIDQLKIKNKSRIFEAKTVAFFNQLKKNDKYQIIFFDPPFSENFFIKELKVIKDSNILNKKHIIIMHREEKSKDKLSDIINIILTKKYGRSKILFGYFNLNID